MNKVIKNTILVGLVIVSAGVVKATENYYQSTLQVGYPYKLIGQFRNYGAGEQRIELNKAYASSAPYQTIRVEYQQKNLIGTHSIDTQEVKIINDEHMDSSIPLSFGTQAKSGKRRYIFYNDLPNQKYTAVYAKDVRMYPKA